MGGYIFKPLTIYRLIRIMTARHMLHHCVRCFVVPGKWVKALTYLCLPLFSTVIGLSNPTLFILTPMFLVLSHAVPLISSRLVFFFL